MLQRKGSDRSRAPSEAILRLTWRLCDQEGREDARRGRGGDQGVSLDLDFHTIPFHGDDEFFRELLAFATCIV